MATDEMTVEEAEAWMHDRYHFPWRAEVAPDYVPEGEPAFWNVVDAVGQIVCPALNEDEARFVAHCVNAYTERI